MACPSIGTTNDMPIVYPPSFEALNLVPFNINPHYFETPPDWTHVGETRRIRIREFIQHNHRPVIGLEEGAILLRQGDELFLRGVATWADLRAGNSGEGSSPGDALHFLLA